MIVLLVADVVDNGASLLRDIGPLPIVSPIAAVAAADVTPFFTRMPQIAGDIAVASNGDVLFADARRGRFTTSPWQR